MFRMVRPAGIEPAHPVPENIKGHFIRFLGSIWHTKIDKLLDFILYIPLKITVSIVYCLPNCLPRNYLFNNN